MPQEANHRLLHRELHSHDAKDIYGAQLELLTDLVNYGSHLILSSFSSSERDLGDTVVTAVMLKQVVLMLDGFQVLLEAGCSEAAQLQARAMFEASVYIDWMLMSDKTNKAEHYYVANVRKDRLWSRRSIEGTDEHSSFLGELGDFAEKMSKSATGQAQIIAAELEKLDEFLSNEPFQSINAAFDQLKGNRSYDRAWYVPLGPTSFRQVVKEVGRLYEYDIFYEFTSETMHASKIRSHASFRGKEMKFVPIRHLLGISAIISFAASIAIRAYRAVLSEYRSGQLTEFDVRYVNDWREAFLNVPVVNYVNKWGGRSGPH